MDFSIETIHQLLVKEVSVQDVLEQQLSDLREKQKMLQGAMDLCEKIIADGCAANLNVENYLYYIREEEAKGKTFAKVDDLLMDFAEYTQFDRMAGDPYVGRFFRNPRVNRIAVALWMLMWLSIPVIALADEWLDGDEISPMKLIFWGAWLLVVVINFIQFRKRK